MSKYEPLWRFIIDKNEDKLKLSFEEIRDILGFEIDHSFLNYKKELTEFHFQVSKISMKEKNVLFIRVDL